MRFILLRGIMLSVIKLSIIMLNQIKLSGSWRRKLVRLLIEKNRAI